MSMSGSNHELEGVDLDIFKAYQAIYFDSEVFESSSEEALDENVPSPGSPSPISNRRTSVQRIAPDRLTSHLPPINFGAVLPGTVYRSSFPLPENFSFMKSLKLKTILTLVPEPFPDPYVGFLEENNIRQVVIPVPANKEIIKVETTTMLQALAVILDRSNYPMLIHCNKGKHRTGCVVGCFRKVQGESLSFALNEYHTYAGVKARSLDVDFIKAFDERVLLWLARENGFLPADEPVVDSRGISNVTLPSSRTRG